MLAAFIKFLDDELREVSPAGDGAPPPSPPRPPADAVVPVPARGFADVLADAYLAIEESRFDSARQLVDELVLSTRQPVRSAGVGAHCPHCSRRVVSVELHVRTCPALAASGAARPPAAALDPQADAARAAQQRLARAVLSELRSPSTPPSLARSLWCAGAGLLLEPGDGEAGRSGDDRGGTQAGAVGSVDAVTAAFADVVVRLFTDFVADVSRELQSVVSVRAVGEAGWLQQQLHSGRPRPLPPFLARFRAVLGPPPWDSTGRPVSSSSLASASAGTGGADAAADAGGSSPSAAPRASAAEAGSVPHIDALTRLLGEAATWLSSILEQPVPHRDRCFVADALHAACARACLPVLEAYRADVVLRGVTATAAALLEHVVRVPVRSGSRDPLDATLEVAGAAAAVATSPHVAAASAGGGAGAARGGFGGGRLGSLRPLGSSAAHPPHAGGAGASAAPQLAPPPAQATPTPPLAVYAGAALAIVDLVADQTSFVCQLLERYLRCLTVCTARGPAGLPSRAPPGDSLASAMQELQAEYVLLEHAYATAATRQLVCSAEGWEPVRLHEDAAVATFSWVDDALYVLSKSLARAAATCCDMAAAAALNYAAEAVGDVLGEAAVRCVELAGAGEGGGGGALRGGGLGVTRAAATRLQVGASLDDDSEAALAAQLSSALLGRHLGAAAAGPNSPARRGGPLLLPASASDSARGRQRQRRSSAAAGELDGGGDEDDEAGVAEARARAAGALNSLHTVTNYLRATFRRALGQYAAVFAEMPPLPSEGGGSGGAARAAARAAEARNAAALIRAAEAGSAAAGPPSLLQAALEPLLRRIRCCPAGLPTPFLLPGEADDAGEAIAGLRAQLQDPLLQLHRVCASLPRGVLCAAWRLAAAAGGEGLRRVAALLRGARYVLSEAEYDWLTAKAGAEGGDEAGLPLVRLVTGCGGGGACASCLLGPGSPLRKALASLEKPDVAVLVLACAAAQCAAALSGEGGGGACDGGDDGGPSSPEAEAAASWRLKPVNEYGALV